MDGDVTRVESAGTDRDVGPCRWPPYIARRAERPPFMTLPLGRWGITRAQVILVPLAIPLVVYGAAYAIAVDAGFAHRNPGAGRWTTDSQIAANLVINLALTASSAP